MTGKIGGKWLVFLTALIFIAGGYVRADAAESGGVTVFAAASTTNAVSEIAKTFTAMKMGEVTLSFASSSTLAKQIDNGAPADVYISANKKWMDYLEKKKMIAADTRFDLLGNRIVLITPLDDNRKIEIVPDFKLAELLGEERLSMGDPDHVPAGIYGKKALENLGAWADVAPLVARAKDVRAALVLVERGESPLGIVYATDAAISRKVNIAGIFPETSHPAIVYPARIIVDRETAAKNSGSPLDALC